MSRGDDICIGKLIGLEYVYANEQGYPKANHSRCSPQSAFESIASGSWHDSGRKGGSNATKRLNTETKSLVNWAKNEGWLIEPESWLDLVPKWELLNGASEHHVYNILYNERVIKSTIPPNFGARGFANVYAQNQLWANEMFGDNICFEGVIDFDGVSIIISQPFIKGESPSLLEIANWFESQGYERAGYNRWRHPITGADIADTHEGNFIKDDIGNLIPIDLQILEPHKAR